MKNKLTTAVLLATIVFSGISVAGQFDQEKMHSVSNVALGIDPDARGDRFLLMKNKPINYDSTNVLAGAAVSSALGNNPVSINGASLANKITVGLDLLSIFGKSKEPVYAEAKTKNSLFGKVYVKEEHENGFQAARDALVQLTNQVVAASKESFGVETNFNLGFIDKQIAELSAKNIKDRKIYSIVEIKLDSEHILYAGIKMLPLVKPAFKNTELQYDYAYENELPYQLTIDFQMRNPQTNKSTFVLNELLQDEKYNAFFAKITEAGNVVLFTQNLKNTFYDGNHYVEQPTAKS
ncbi:MAG: hypothetical protein ACTS9Y_00120 [Methylophilus sp.]|uniref:hypothetical protein n=1 Tax=Methylophilus sp. TaxID=29541 RepID=UPI003F9FFB6A